MKILVFNKMKIKGLSYDQACKELDKEVIEIVRNTKKKKDPKPNFKEEFKNIKNGRKT